MARLRLIYFSNLPFQIMNLMIDYVTTFAEGNDAEMWKGYFYAGKNTYIKKRNGTVPLP